MVRSSPCKTIRSALMMLASRRAASHRPKLVLSALLPFRTKHKTSATLKLRHLIVKVGIVELTVDDRTTIYGAMLWMADKLQSDERDKALALRAAKGKQAFAETIDRGI
jgi:hypothetical protein